MLRRVGIVVRCDRLAHRPHHPPCIAVSTSTRASVAEREALPRRARHDLAVDRHRHAARVGARPRRSSARDGLAGRRSDALAVEHDHDGTSAARPSRVAASAPAKRARIARRRAARRRGSLARRAGPATSSAVSGASRMPLRWWPVAHISPSELAAADRRHVVGRARAQARATAPRSPARSTPGTQLVRVAQQLVDAAGRRRELEAPLLDRRAEHVAPVAAGHHVAAVEAHHALEQARPGRIAQAQDLALDRAHRHRVLGQRRRARRSRRPAASDDRARAAQALAARPSAHARDAPARSPSQLDPRDAARARAARRPPARTRARSAASTRRGSTQWSSGASQREPHASARAPARARAPGSGAAARHARPSDSRKRELALELARLVVVAREQQRARPAQPDLDARSPLAARRRTPATARAERSPSSSTRRPASPNSASATGASMPAATREVPPPSASRSSTITDRPRARARQAIASPITPPPTITTRPSSARCRTCD